MPVKALTRDTVHVYLANNVNYVIIGSIARLIASFFLLQDVY
jgi:hypothetical protein